MRSADRLDQGAVLAEHATVPIGFGDGDEHGGGRTAATSSTETSAPAAQEDSTCPRKRLPPFQAHAARYTAYAMPELGYALSCEEHRPNDLVRYARGAEATGFPFALISDHFHPWLDEQGQSPFVWSVIGAIAQATERLRLGTGVTCPLIRIHPAIVAHAAATSAAMMPGRFFLGVGSGENLNEHVTGARWPFDDERQDMLEEAIEIMRQLWQGGYQTHRGRFYRVERARLYTLPDEPPEIMMAAAGSRAAEIAGRVADGLITTAPDEQLVSAFEESGGSGKPEYGQVTACWAKSEDEAVETAHRWWRNAAVDLTPELPTPEEYAKACSTVRPEDVADKIACGPDPERHLSQIREFGNAGFDYVYVHQIGPDQEGFFRFYERDVLPKL
jgi:coenzyme F420-dependent glucose-6-phosphate dehydrogenase